MNLGFEKNIPRYESRTESMMQLDWAEKVIVRRLSVKQFVYFLVAFLHFSLSSMMVFI